MTKDPTEVIREKIKKGWQVRYRNFGENIISILPQGSNSDKGIYIAKIQIVSKWYGMPRDEYEYKIEFFIRGKAPLEINGDYHIIFNELKSMLIPPQVSLEDF